MIDVPAAIEQQRRQIGGGDLALSRATWLAKERWQSATSAVPVVGGVTVWAAVGDDCIPVVEYPNWFGRIERAQDLGREAIKVIWWPPAVLTPSAGAIEAHQDIGTLAAARNLAGRLRQLPGVKLPHGQPESPWFVVGLPGNAAKVASDLSIAGFAGSEAFGERFPEFPGGLRIQVAWATENNEQFVELVQSALGR